MTKGLLISRMTKNNLYKSAVKLRTNEAWIKFKSYRNIYNSVLRNSKKIYFSSNLEKNQKNPKKTWDLLKEAANISKSHEKIEN